MVSRVTHLLVCWIQTQRRGVSGDLPWHVVLSLPMFYCFCFKTFLVHISSCFHSGEKDRHYCLSLLHSPAETGTACLETSLIAEEIQRQHTFCLESRSGCSCLRWDVLDLRCTISRASFSRGITLRKIVILPGGNVFGAIPSLTESCFLGMSCLALSYCEYYLNSSIFYKLLGFRKWLCYCLDFFSVS